ncbi:MAG: hypothetical protein ACLQVJ_02750 [Syntrophobacteraceae bacterium]
MNRKNLILAAIFVVGFFFFMNVESQVKAADQWFVLGQKTIKSADQGVDIKSEGGFLNKNVKQVKLSVEGADVQITKLVLRYNNRPDQEVNNIGILKSGGQSTPMDAPGRKARLESVTVTYKIVGDAQSAALKVWGYD